MYTPTLYFTSPSITSHSPGHEWTGWHGAQGAQPKPQGENQRQRRTHPTFHCYDNDTVLMLCVDIHILNGGLINKTPGFLRRKYLVKCPLFFFVHFAFSPSLSPILSDPLHLYQTSQIPSVLT